MAVAAIVELSDENFEREVIKSQQPVLVEFRADWCMPCDMIAPAIAELAEEFADCLKFGRIDVESNSEVPTKYSVNPLPTLLLFQGGDVIKEFVGVKEKQELQAALQSVIG